MTCTVRQEWGLACPRCGNADKLEITITCTAELTIEGSEPFGDHDWGDDSHCRCPDCGHGGLVANFRYPKPKTRKERKRP